jgi:hypothetical protein
MKKKIITTTIVAMSLLSLNLSAAGKMKCTDKYCIIDLSKLASPKKNKEMKKSNAPEEKYTTQLIDNVETIVFTDETYIMTEDEKIEYKLKTSLEELTTPSLNSNLPDSQFFCEEHQKPVKVAGLDNTYRCDSDS